MQLFTSGLTNTTLHNKLDAGDTGRRSKEMEMKKFMVFSNDGNSFTVEAQDENDAREKMVPMAIDGFTSIFGVIEL